jgi:hypothetical protein
MPVARSKLDGQGAKTDSLGKLISKSNYYRRMAHILESMGIEDRSYRFERDNIEKHFIGQIKEYERVKRIKLSREQIDALRCFVCNSETYVSSVDSRGKVYVELNCTDGKCNHAIKGLYGQGICPKSKYITMEFLNFFEPVPYKYHERGN